MVLMLLQQGEVTIKTIKGLGIHKERNSLYQESTKLYILPAEVATSAKTSCHPIRIILLFALHHIVRLCGSGIDHNNKNNSNQSE